MNQMLDRDEIDDKLTQITPPALVLHGKDDNGIPVALGNKLASDLPDAKFVETSGEHSSVLTYAEEHIPLIRAFMKEI